MYDIELRYIANYSVAAFRAATHVLCHGELNDGQLNEALADSIHGLTATLESYGKPLEQFSRHAPPLAGQIDNNLRLGEIIFRKCTSVEPNSVRDKAFARNAISLEQAFKKAVPNFLDDLENQAEPLKREWLQWGPQLLTGFARQTSPQMLTSRADVYLAPAMTGMPGVPFVPYNSVLLEVDDQPLESAPRYGVEIPERVFALAWYLTQLNTDLPMYAENLSRGGNEKIGAFSTIPALLASAETMGVGRCSLDTITNRLQVWLPDSADEETATTIWNWWQTYIHGETTWPVAMIALDRMLHPTCQRGSAEFV